MIRYPGKAMAQVTISTNYTINKRIKATITNGLRASEALTNRVRVPHTAEFFTRKRNSIAHSLSLSSYQHLGMTDILLIET